MTEPAATAADVLVIGSGLIGLSTAWRLAQHGLAVTVVDPAPLSAASHVAAGMLAPVSEVRYGEEPLLQLAIESLRRYPSFVEELEQGTGLETGLRRDGTLVVATDAGDRDELAELHAFQASLGLTSSMLSGRECRSTEPLLSPAVQSGLLVESDHSIDNRQLGKALLSATRQAGVRLIANRCVELIVHAGRATGVRLEDRREVPAGIVVLAAGPWSAVIGGLPPDTRPPVRPVKGHILRLRASRHVPLPTHSVRGFVNGAEVYLVPRTSGELVVGATVEEMGFDTTVRAGAVRELLRDARAVIPLIDEFVLEEAIAGLRPGSPDNAPIIGGVELDGLIVATGHHRNGVLLTPVTADLVTGLVVGEAAELAPLYELCSPRRFATIGAVG